VGDIAAGVFMSAMEPWGSHKCRQRRWRADCHRHTGHIDAPTVSDTTLATPQPERLLLPRSLAYEELLLGQIASICATAQQLRKRNNGDSSDLAQLILADAARLVEMLKRINVISPLAYNPGQPHTPPANAPSVEPRQVPDTSSG
jgi:hypothetical protein